MFRLPTTIQAPSPASSDEGPSNQDVATSDTLDRHVQGRTCYERQLGDSEISYYFQSRATGVNDMFALANFCGVLVGLPY